ncbi:MAG: hypothetical protein AB1512_10050 [Thermodesulfobacteriota bacterium]
MNGPLLTVLKPVVCFLFLFFMQAPLWAQDAPSRTRKPSSRGVAPSPQKKPAKKETRSAQKKEARKKKAGDTKPMPPLNDASFRAEVPLLPILRAGKDRLARERVSYFPSQNGKPGRREVKLAIADFQAGRIRIVSGTEENQGLVLNDPDVRYAVNWWNGFNSSIDILEPSNTAIVGLLYALDPKRRSVLRRDSIIYTPYSNALLQPELVEAGRLYLDRKIAQAQRELRHVSSRVRCETTLEMGPGFTREDYFNVILAEHLDPEAFRSVVGNQVILDPERESALRRLVGRILVIIGANQEDAYRFTGNYASARGLTQFTPVGMQVVWNRYTAADISKDFYEATADHLLAIKAEICLLDHYLAEMLRAYPALGGTWAEKYAAGACYNGGPKNVLYGLKNFGVEWLHPQQRISELTFKGSLTAKERRELGWLRKYRNHETFVYLNKLHAIERLQAKSPEGSAPSEHGHEPGPPMEQGETEWVWQ